MSTESLTIAQVKEAQAFLAKSGNQDHAYRIGEAYFVRTVTMYYTGRLKRVTAGELVLENAAWIADTGRFADALSDGIFKEVEPYPGDIIVSRLAIVDACIWKHDLPVNQK